MPLLRSKTRGLLGSWTLGSLLALFAIPGWAGPAVATRSGAYERVAEAAELQGPGSALELAAKAVDQQPDSLALLLQYTEILIETKGVPRARGVLELRRASLPKAHLRMALALCDRLTGRTRAARQKWASLGALPPTTRRGLDRWAMDLERLFLRAQPESTDALASDAQAVGSAYGGEVENFTRSRLAWVRAREAQDPTSLDTPETDSRLWTRARTLLLRARLHTQRGELESAEHDFRRCAGLADSIGALRTAGLARSYFGHVLDGQSRFREATEALRRSVDTFEAFDDSLPLAWGLLGLGWSLKHTASSEESIQISTRALELWTALENPWAQTQALMNLGVAYFAADRWVSASNCYERGLEIVSKSQNVQQRLMLLNDVALLESRRGRPDRAVDIYREILEVHRQRGDISAQMEVLNNLGLACLSLGESEQAREYFRIAIEQGEREGQVRVAPLVNLAMILADEGELEEASARLRRVRTVAEARGDRGLLADVLSWMGRVEQRAGDQEAALSSLSAADSLQELLGAGAQRVPTLLRRGSIELELGESSAARRSAERAQRVAEDLGVLYLSGAAQSLRARVERAAGNFDLARSYALGALDAFAHQVRDGDSLFDRAGVEKASVDALRVLTQIQASVPEDPLSSVQDEILRCAMDLLDRQETPFGVVSGADVDSLRRREQRLRRAVESMRAMPTATSALMAQHQWELADAETAWNAARRDLVRSLRSAAAAEHRTSESAFRAALDPDTVLLAYLMPPTQPGRRDAPVLRLWMDSQHPLRVECIGGERTLRTRIGLWRSLTEHPSRNATEAAAERRIAAQLGDALLPRGLTTEAQGRHLVIAANGALSASSFAALIVPSESGARLAEIVTIERVISWNHWLRRQDDRTASATPPPSLVRAEPAELAAAVRSESPWPRAAVLHIGSHGYFDLRRPWLSGLYFENPAGADSMAEPFLQLADLPLLRLDHRLVTLAACETAQREDSPLHSSVQSFAAALQGAGSRAVLGSSWEVDRDLADWTCDRVYAELAHGRTLSEALREAQIALLENRRTRDPFYWAGWRVMGDGAQRIRLPERHAPKRAWVWWSLSALLAALALMLWRRPTSAG